MYKKKLPRAISRQAAGASDVDFAAVAPTDTVQPALQETSRKPGSAAEIRTARDVVPPVQSGKDVPVTSHEAASAKPINGPTDPRRAHAMKLIERFSLASGAAGLIPMPFLDLAVVSGMQIEMIRRIAKLYGVPFSETRGKALLAGLAGSMIPGSSGIGAASVVKGVPVIGTVIGAFATPTLFTGATYAVGRAFVEHFASGGTLADFNRRTVAVSS